MANANLVGIVTINLPSWREELTDWDAQKISDMLDTFDGNVNLTCRQFWLQRVSDTQSFIDVNEGGSAANQSQDHEHAVAMLAYWDKQIAQGGRTSVGRIKPRYVRPRVAQTVDEWGYGGPYARTN